MAMAMAMAEGGGEVKKEEEERGGGGGGEKASEGAFVGAIVKVERWRDRRGRLRMARPHPLAGRTGEGAPIAPPGWLWKAGYRNSDMYFYSPLGEKFRSQLQLQTYLANVPNPPPLSAFRWRIRPEEFKDGPLPGVPPEDPPQPSARKKGRSASTELSVANKRRKLTTKKKPAQLKLKERPRRTRKVNDHSVDAVKKSSDMQTNGFTSKIGRKLEHGQGKRRKKETDRTGKKETVNSSFSHLLSAPTSYNVLSKNAEILQKFLDEAARLKEKGEQEIDELRNVLLIRKHSAAQLSKYPESVLRVFFFLLRNEEPPSSFGTKELIEFCSKWSCKHKHYWCLLESSRLETFEPFLPNSPIAFTMKENGEQMLVRSDAQDVLHQQMAGNGIHQSQQGLEESSMIFPFQKFDNSPAEDTKDLAGWQETQAIDGVPNECAERVSGDMNSIDQIVHSKGVIEASPIESEFCAPEAGEIGNQFLTPRHAGESMDLDEKDLILTAEDLAVKADDAYLSKETFQKNLEDFYATPHLERESVEAQMNHGQLVLYEDYKPQPHPSKCGCQICSRDPFFCYGCTCSLCKVFIQHKQSWMFIKCPICSHFCHLECSLKARRAGVVKELDMDGEFLCPCCLNKSDLVPFWIDRVKDALTSIDRPMVQKYLTSAVLVFNGTQRQDFQTVHRNVMELHDSLLYNTPCPHLQQILQQIQEKVEGFSAAFNHTERSVDPACLPGLDMQEAEVFQEEEKVREGQKRAELDYVEWLLAEKNADTQRLILRDAQEEMKKAELDIRSKASHARASRTSVQQAENRLHLLKRNSTFKALSKEQLEKQRAALDLELAELNKLQNELGSLSSETHEDSDIRFSPLLEDFKTQRKRVETAKARLEQIDFLNNFFV
ncbi:hypothetical protein O6H91_07G010400 [Diphasiastrum complanatum]|uniref:Uncharacterized protein n=2 Tax=Diphasiastrum complanatum TaxID=34168 RepID=A0ACC2D2A7_DIPCM|nr:hypothetical protein O6H91_07G010400 [Diphasiastrum complanatum]